MAFAVLLSEYQHTNGGQDDNRDKDADEIDNWVFVDGDLDMDVIPSLDHEDFSVSFFGEPFVLGSPKVAVLDA